MYFSAAFKPWSRVCYVCLFCTISIQQADQNIIAHADDKILVDLGAKPDGSSPEFGNGLREIIHNIRARKIRDFNTVASEITAYRARFLGDSSKVLPL